MDIYDRLGVRKVINAHGLITTLGGSRMPREAFKAMEEAGAHFVSLNELHEKAGKYIADLVGVEAAYVCSGAAGGMVLAAAAVLTGRDKAKISKLPDTRGWRNEIIVQKSRPGNYVHQGMRCAGARLVEVGDEHAATASDFESALSETSAAIQLYLRNPRPSIDEIAPVARRANIPVIVDAAAELPSRLNFRAPLESGADLIVFSGGKGICGPQATGLILGRGELVEACRMNGNPNSAVGRPMKVGKEDIAALVAAVELYVARDEEAETREFERRSDYIVGALADVLGVRARTVSPDPELRPAVPRTFVELSEIGLAAADVGERLRSGTPSIEIGTEPGTLCIDVMQLGEMELETVARRLREVLTEPASALT